MPIYWEPFLGKYIFVRFQEFFSVIFLQESFRYQLGYLLNNSLIHFGYSNLKKPFFSQMWYGRGNHGTSLGSIQTDFGNRKCDKHILRSNTCLERIFFHPQDFNARRKNDSISVHNHSSSTYFSIF